MASRRRTARQLRELLADLSLLRNNSVRHQRLIGDQLLELQRLLSADRRDFQESLNSVVRKVSEALRSLDQGDQL